ncbi:MAG TPA: hypothetical protein GX503_04605 [Clostridiales bacterium]|nr:hypothetical protein [Clostridiales bacterium]
MPIRPIDYQVLIPKTQQVSRENQILNDKLRLEHQQLVQHDQKNIQLKMQKVNEFESKDHPQIRDHKEKNRHANDSEQKEQKKKKGKQTFKSVSGVGTKIDLKV